MSQPRKTIRGIAVEAGDYLSDLIFRCLIGYALRLPYEKRVRFLGKVVDRLIAPLAGWRKRIRDNLNSVMPELSASEVEKLVHAVPDTAGRMIIELYSNREFNERAQNSPISGPGLSALKKAHKEGRPILLVTGHFGNFVAVRPAFATLGIPVGVLYRAQTNRHFNRHYVAAIESQGTPNFEEGKRGMVQMVKYLRKSGVLGILTDVHVHNAPRLDFLGQPAATSIATAEMALKYDAALIPVYAIRQSNGYDFEIFVDEEIPHSEPIEMTKAINRSLECMVRAHPEQWFWIHRRWKD